MTEVILTQADAGKRVEIAAGDTVTLRLPENPTTGHRWQLATEGAALVDSSFAPAASTAAGAAGERTLTLTARAPGRAPVRLVYKQPWLADSEAAETFEFELVVTAKP